MKVGCVKETKLLENRVGLTPPNVKSYVNAGNQLFMEDQAGLVRGFTNEEYVVAGASTLPTAKEVWDISDIIVKVKEPLEPEIHTHR